MNLANPDIRSAARASHVPLWMLAKHLGISEPSMTRKLRFELSADEREKMLAAIEELKEGR